MLNKLLFGLLIGCAATAFSQTSSDIQSQKGNSAYSQDGSGNVARSPFGLCWRTGYWTPDDSVTGCDGPLVPPVANPTAPAIAAPASAAAPVAVAPAAPPSPQRCDFAVTLSNDLAFEFNKAVLTNAAKRRIDDEVIGKLASCSRIEVILVTGHADRLGAQKYNQKLSEKRAAAVANYLKAKGVVANIHTLGAGKTMSIKSCDDKLGRKKLVECLAPNRRVVIETRGVAK
jgi:OmpA-OmpF porin, OOP family